MKIMTGKTFQGASCAMLMLCLAAFSNASAQDVKASPEPSATAVSKAMLIGIKAEVADQNGYVKTLHARVIENGKTFKATDHSNKTEGYGSEYAFDITGWGSDDGKAVHFSVVAKQKNEPPATSYNIVSYQDVSVGSEIILPLGGGDKNQHYLVLGVTSITPAATEDKSEK
ncbi:hypothetical protein RYA05_04195 [Pseudomonas syringae pv. actinidiae]|nr:hypothetical protein [Pseudomonas syringae pv. actinidiae]